MKINTFAAIESGINIMDSYDNYSKLLGGFNEPAFEAELEKTAWKEKLSAFIDKLLYILSDLVNKITGTKEIYVPSKSVIADVYNIVNREIDLYDEEMDRIEKLADDCIANIKNYYESTDRDDYIKIPISQIKNLLGLLNSDLKYFKSELKKLPDDSNIVPDARKLISIYNKLISAVTKIATRGIRNGDKLTEKYEG